MDTRTAPLVNESATNSQIPPVPPSKPSPSVSKKAVIVGLLLGILIISTTAIIVAGRLLSKPKTHPTAQLVPSPSSNIPVDLRAEYQNPFAQSARYTNPFDSYENPFDALK